MYPADNDAPSVISGYRPALDGLRGLAVAGVLAYHAGHLTGGYLGVDLFFVLSGFLITGLLLDEHDRVGRIDLRHFWGKRARRLLPALLVVLTATFAYWRLTADPATLGELRDEGLAALAYVSNWHAISSGNSYFALFAEPSPLRHLWSLAVEEQFYLLWPLVAVAALRGRRGGPMRLLAVTLALLAASAAALVLVWDPADHNRAYLGTDTRAAGLLIGAAVASLVAYFGHAERLASRVVLDVAASAAAVALGVAWFTVDVGDPGLYRGGLALAGVGAVIVIAAAANPRPGVLARVLSVPALTALGRISYALYLWHWPVYVVIDADRVGFDGWLLTGVRAAASVALATASLRVVERPLRLRAFNPRGYTAAVAGVVLVALYATRAPARLPNDGALRLLVVGDSIAGDLAGGVIAAGADDPTFTVIDGHLNGCGLFDTARTKVAGDRVVESSPECRRVLERWTQQIAEEDPEVVLLSASRWDGTYKELDGAFVTPCAAQFTAAYQARVDAALDILTARGAVVGVATATDNSGRHGRTWTDCINAVYRDAAAARADVFALDVDDYLCEDDRCPEDLGGAALWRDPFHYSAAGARTIAGWMAPQLEAAVTASGDPVEGQLAAPRTKSADGRARLALSVPAGPVSGIVPLDVVADAPDLARVDVFDGARWVGAATAAPWSVGWDTTKATDGPHRLKLKVTTSDGTTRYEEAGTVVVANG